MKTTLLLLAALATTMIVLPVEASPTPEGVMCSKQSIAASRLWLKRETEKATELRDFAKRPRPEKADYWIGERYREETMIWLADQQLAATANQSVLLANAQLESLIIDCAILKRLGLGA